MTTEELNLISRDIVDVAVHIHKELGPGLRESVYEKVFAVRLRRRGRKVDRQRRVSAVLDGVQFRNAFRPDIVVEDSVVVEIKADPVFRVVHVQQVITYLKAADLRLGFVLNFGMPTMKVGIRRLANRL